MKYEELFHELKYADFSHIEKPPDYFLEAPPLPQEELEHNNDKEEEKNSLFSNMNSDSSMMGRVGGMGMQAGASSMMQPNMPMMMNQAGGPMGGRPRMMAATSMMPGAQMPHNPMHGVGNPQMMYGQQGQQMPMQKQQLPHQQLQPQSWGGGGGGYNSGTGMAVGSQQAMGYPAPPYGAPQQGMGPVGAMGQAGAMGPRFGGAPQTMGGVVGGIPGNQVSL
jgi:hypothetical protein